MRRTGRTTKNLIKLAYHASQSADNYYFISRNSEIVRYVFDAFLRMFSEQLIREIKRSTLSVTLHNGSHINFIGADLDNEYLRGKSHRKYICDHDTYVTDHHFIFSNKDISNV